MINKQEHMNNWVM